MKKAKPMTCRWCGRCIRRLADGTHTHRARRVTHTSSVIDLGPIKLPARTTVDDRPEMVECYTTHHGRQSAAPKPGRVAS